MSQTVHSNGWMWTARQGVWIHNDHWTIQTTVIKCILELAVVTVCTVAMESHSSAETKRWQIRQNKRPKPTDNLTSRVSTFHAKLLRSAHRVFVKCSVFFFLLHLDTYRRKKLLRHLTNFCIFHLLNIRNSMALLNFVLIKIINWSKSKDPVSIL